MPTKAIVDTGPLILLADESTKQERRRWLQALVRKDVSMLIPPGVATEFLRGARDHRSAYWWLSHLQGIDTTYEVGHRAGLLLRQLRDPGVSVIDAQVVQHAIEEDAVVLTSDLGDLRRLASVSGRNIRILELPWPI
ncbi:MAG: type II toxin-antitoxin system VapC family toxin [Chloroflexota bacterium]